MIAPTLAVGLLARSADAQRRRPRFEPTDVEVSPPGQLGVDLELGVVRDGSALHAYLPDVEVDLGLTDEVELDVDGTLSLSGPDPDTWNPLALDPDNLWVSLKVAVAGHRDRRRNTSWAVGFQAGPRVALAQGAHGLGGEALVLVGGHVRRLHLTANLGAYSEPAVTGQSTARRALLGGLDVALDLDARGAFTLQGELYAVFAPESGEHEFGVSAGLAWSLTPRWALAATAIVGWANGGPSAGLLLGVSPTFQLW